MAYLFRIVIQLVAHKGFNTGCEYATGGLVMVYKGKVNADGLASLAALPKLPHSRKRFWTNSKTITSAVWVHLAGLAKIGDLFLSETNFGDDDLRSQEGMKTLKSLGLNKTKITDAEMPSLAGMTSLQDLGLDDTRITDTPPVNQRRLHFFVESLSSLRSYERFGFSEESRA